MYWRKVKLNIIIGLVILGVILFITVPIIISATTKDKVEENNSTTPEAKRFLN